MARPLIAMAISSSRGGKTNTAENNMKSKKVQNVSRKRKTAKERASFLSGDRPTGGIPRGQKGVKAESASAEKTLVASHQKKRTSQKGTDHEDQEACITDAGESTPDRNSRVSKGGERRDGAFKAERVEGVLEDIQQLEDFLFGKNKRRKQQKEDTRRETTEDASVRTNGSQKKKRRRKGTDFPGDAAKGGEQVSHREVEDESGSCEGVSSDNAKTRASSVGGYADKVVSSQRSSLEKKQKQERLPREPAAFLLSRLEGDGDRAWVDPDDEQLVVDLATQPKLRKLRKKLTESRVSGVVFQERLKELRGKRMNTGTSVDWVEKARQRKLDEQCDQMAEGYGSDSSRSEGIQAVTRTGQSIAGVHSGPQRNSVYTGQLGALTTPDGRMKGIMGQGKLSIKRLENANKAERSGSAISALEFHPRMPLLLTGGRDKTLRIFSIDGQNNSKVESLHLLDYPIFKAHFTQHDEGRHVLAVSNANRSLVDYDLETGDVLVCDARTKRLLTVLSMNARVAGIAYHPARNSIFTADREAYVYEWDMRTGGCIDKFQDAACLRLSALAASPAVCAAHDYHPSALLATGSRTGFVGLFSLSVGEPTDRNPTKELGNLTTEITTLAFHPTNQLICMASKWKKDAFRIVHVPSSTVYQNWPTERSPLRYVTAADFSPDRGFLAVGNDRGNALLYQLRHFA